MSATCSPGRPWTVVLLLGCLFGRAGGAHGDDWPQWMGPQRDGVWRETGVLEAFPASGPTTRWTVPVGGGYSGPAVADGRVFLTDRVVKEGQTDPASPFTRGSTPALERVWCFDEANGDVLWRREYDCPYTVSYPAGPRCTPTVDGDHVYTLGAEGHLNCLQTVDGAVVWSHALVDKYKLESSPIWGFAAHPLVEGDLLICLVGGPGTTVVAFDKATGEERWRALDSFTAHGPGYCPPQIIERGGQRRLLVWHPAGVSLLDPTTGAVDWTYDWEIREGLTAPNPRLLGDELFLTAFYDGAQLLRLSQDGAAPQPVWRRKGRSERTTDALQSIIATPVFTENLIVGVDSYGELRGLDPDTGDRLWSTFEATGGESARWANAFLTPHADRFFLANERGELIIARLTREGFQELSRAALIEPTGAAQQRQVVWSHPAYATRSIYLRNDKELRCVSLAAE